MFLLFCTLLICILYIVLLLSVSCPVTIILLHCGASVTHYNKFLVCVNIAANKAHSDLLKQLIHSGTKHRHVASERQNYASVAVFGIIFVVEIEQKQAILCLKRKSLN